MSYRVMIVDDERLARERLKLMLSAEADLEIVAECTDGDEALEQLSKLKPDLLFLDIKMPGLSGLDVAERIKPGQVPVIVFLTAFRDHAVEAFRLEAMDYLTKPVEKERLQQTLERARKALTSKDQTQIERRLAAVLEHFHAKQSERAYTSRLLVSDGPKDVLLPVRGIEWIEASDYYSSIHVKQRTYLLRESLADLESKLDPETFVRVHRSALVNLDYVQEIHREGVKEGMLTLTSGASIRMSKSGRQRLRSLMQE